jgi:murein DD-endopeptidase
MGINSKRSSTIGLFLTHQPWVFFLALGSIALGGCNRLEQTSIASPKTNPTPSASAPRLGLPIDCELDRDCYILHYVDRDPDPNQEIDYNCGRQTYDGHKGTDFGIPDEQAMAQGVAVLASADGTVLRVRDGQPDRRAHKSQKWKRKG